MSANPQVVSAVSTQTAPDTDEDTAVTETVATQIEPILSLRPTQLAVGFQAAREKADRIGDKKSKGQTKYLRTHPVPVVVGPDGNKYIIDHHHLCVACLQLDISSVYVTVRDDWSDSPSMDDFWRRMHDANYVWLNDPNGREISLEDFLRLLPKNVTGLQDDPYRSLAATVRRSGGYEKVWTPFAEFHWANFFRKQIPITFTDKQVDKALKLAGSPLALGLPGHTPKGDGDGDNDGDRNGDRN